MAFATRSSLHSVIVLVLLMTVEHAATIKVDASAMFGHFPSLLDCAPPPPPSRNHSAFRDNVLSVLSALPSAVAAAPAGFAATRSGGRDDCAFARGLCFGFGERRGDCIACLSAAARDVAGGCDGSRRGAVWRAGCFLLAYADTNASSAREDTFRG
ncbi:unnamed protein product [Urochloa humidicola]